MLSIDYIQSIVKISIRTKKKAIRSGTKGVKNVQQARDITTKTGIAYGNSIWHASTGGVTVDDLSLCCCVL